MAWVLLLAACGQPPGPTGPTAQVEAVGSNPLLDAAEPSADETSFAGVIHQRLAAGGYSYLEVRTADGGIHWVATLGPGADVGDQVGVRVFAAHDDFDSRRLGRRFDRVLFGSVHPQLEQGRPS
jgi:hypothetical protein